MNYGSDSAATCHHKLFYFGSMSSELAPEHLYYMRRATFFFLMALVITAGIILLVVH
jgi:hypothetical protein